MCEVAEGKADKTDNVLKNAPHTHKVLTADEWTHTYPRSKAAYPLPWVAENKFWPQVGRVDDGYGDRNLMLAGCSIIAIPFSANNSLSKIAAGISSILSNL